METKNAVPTSKEIVPWYKEVDGVIAGVCAGAFAAFLIWSQVAGDSMGEIMSSALAFLTQKVGAIYLITAFVIIAFCLYLVFSKYGSIRLGADDEKPEYPFFAWFSMLFAACYGSGLVYWGVAEPLTFIGKPPFAIVPGSIRAGEISLAYAFFHWGFTPWAMTALPAVAFGYFLFRKNMSPRYSMFLKPLLGDNYGNALCRMVDALLVVSAVGAMVCCLGLGVKQFVFGLNSVLGIPNNMFVTMSFCLLTVATYTISCVSGLDKGIKFLSTTNVYLALGVTAFVFLVGPTFFTLDISTQAFGELLNNYFRMSFNTDPIGKSGFSQGWTIFYWAWWFSCAAQVGLFAASISRGRTIREMIIGIILFAPLGTFCWIGTMGGTAIYQQFFGGTDLVAILQNVGTDGALWAFLNTLPFSKLLGVAHLCLIFLFLVTTCNSGAYVWSQNTMHQQYKSLVPSKPVRLTYCLALSVVAMLLLLRGKGISGLQLMPVVVSSPIIIIFIVMMVAAIKALREDSSITK